MLHVPGFADELIQESLQLNTHAKRHIEALHQQQQAERKCDTAAAAAAAAATSSDDEDWSTKPSRGARKAARRSGRQKQQRQAGRAVSSRTKDTHGSASDSLWEETDATSATDSDTADPAAGDTGATADMDDALASLTLERRLSSTTAATAGAGAHVQPAATAADAAAEGSSLQQRLRPVVVGMLGEPNVGKSSTLNVLLGSHRVAVSSHPVSHVSSTLQLITYVLPAECRTTFRLQDQSLWCSTSAASQNRLDVHNCCYVTNPRVCLWCLVLSVVALPAGPHQALPDALHV